MRRGASTPGPTSPTLVSARPSKWSKTPHVCKVTTYLLHREHREPVYNTVARHLRGVAPCGTGLIISGLAMADMLVEFDVDVVIPA